MYTASASCHAKLAPKSKFFGATLVAVLLLAGLPARGAPANAPGAPSFVDPALRLDRPALTGVRAIRFLTTDDYPPLNFALPDGSLSGFNVDVARAICKELAIGCTIQARRWDTLIDSLTGGKGDAVVASVSSGDLRNVVDFSLPYYKTPARFVARKDAPPVVVSPPGLAGKTVGVVAGTAHQAYLNAFFPGASAKPFATSASSRRR